MRRGKEKRLVKDKEKKQWHQRTMVQNRKKPSQNSHLMRFSTSSGVSEGASKEANKQTDKRMAQYLHPDSWPF